MPAPGFRSPQPILDWHGSSRGDELPSAAARRWFSLVDAGDSSKEMEGSALENMMMLLISPGP